jgi:hypothetical protein
MYPNNCPECGISLRGEPIPLKDREFFGNETHFNRVIGIYERQLDKTIIWLCPDCGYRWSRENTIHKGD